MSGAEKQDFDLDVLCQEILHALEEHDGHATTSEIRKFLGLDSRTKLNYRINEYLLPQSLISTHQPEGEPGKWPPKEVSLTDQGREALETIAQENEINRDIAARVERIEESLESLRDENHDLRQENKELREQIDELETGGGTPAGAVDVDADLQERVNQLIVEVDEMKDDLDELKDDPIFDERIRAEIDDLRSGIYAVTQFIVDEFDAKDEIDELDAEISESIDPLSDQSK